MKMTGAHSYCRAFCAGGLLVLFQPGLMLAGPPEPERSVPPSDELKQAAARLQLSRQRGGKALDEQVRLILNSLIVGRHASEPSLSLHSGAYDAMKEGLERLRKLDKELKDPSTGPEKEKELYTKHPELVALFDAIRLRPDVLESLEETSKLSRAAELARLSKLRELNRTYRDLTGELAAINTYLLLGDEDKGVRERYKKVAARVSALKEMAVKHQDLYLLSDEPRLDAAELKLLGKVTEPVVKDLATHFQSLQALVAYRLASRYPGKVDKDRLMEATSLAESILDDLKAAEQAAKPTDMQAKEWGARRLLALYVRGLSQRELALLRTASDPLSRKVHDNDETKRLRRRAAASFTEADKLLPEHKALAELLTKDVKRAVSELGGAKAFLEKAERLTLDGRPDSAVELLNRGLRMWLDGRLLLARATASVRAGEDLARERIDLERALTEELVKRDDLDGLLVRGRVAVSDAWDRLSRPRSIASLSSAERESLRGQLREATTLLAQVRDKAKESIQEPQAQAYLAFARACLTYLEPTAEAVEAKALYLQLPDIVAKLTQQRRRNAAAQLRADEALVAARMAQGFFAVRFLPRYRDEAVLAFAAAADAQSRIKFTRPAIKLLGSPLVSSMLERPDGANLRLAAEERQLRQLLARFAEASVALHQGEVKGAAQLVSPALRAVATDTQTSVVDAAEMLDRREADAREALHTRMRALAILILAAGGETGQAVREAVKGQPRQAELPPGPPSEERRRAALSAIQDPLGGYALGFALEEYAVAQLPPGSKDASQYLEQARAAQKKTSELLRDSSVYRDRYPQVVALNRQALERLTKPETFLTEASRLRSQGRIAEALRVLRSALRRHPDDRPLFQEWISVRIDEADLTGDRNHEQLRAVLREVMRAEQEGRVKDARGYLTLGELYERLGQESEASAAYRRVLAVQPTDEEKIVVMARLAVLEARRRE